MVRVCLQGVSAAASMLAPSAATYMDGGHFAATREFSPRTQAVLVICIDLSNVF